MDDSGEAGYISAVVYILIVVLTLMLMLDSLSLVVTKQKLDTAADQLTRQIQLAGKVDDDTENLFAYLTQDLSDTESIVYTVDSAFITKSGCNKAIQLGTPFYVTVTAQSKLGSFLGSVGIPVTLHSRCCGVSERYWK